MTFKPRAPRIRLSPLHRVQFNLLDKGRETPIGVGNISKSGMGLLREAVKADVGSVLNGHLQVNENVFDLGAEVKQATSSILGCQFVSGATKEAAAAITNYFRVEICGLQLKKIDPKFLKQVPNGQIVWFTDGNANEVYFLMDKNGVQEFHLTFLGNYVEGGRNKALRAGYVVEEFDVKQTTHKGSDLLEMGPGIENEVLFLGIQLVENTEQMPKEQRELLVKLLRG